LELGSREALSDGGFPQGGFTGWIFARARWRFAAGIAASTFRKLPSGLAVLLSGLLLAEGRVSDETWLGEWREETDGSTRDDPASGERLVCVSGGGGGQTGWRGNVCQKHNVYL